MTGPRALPSPAEDRAAVLAALADTYEPVNWKDAWHSQPEEVSWLYGEFLEAGTINALYAKAGTGKSLLVLEIALAIARAGHTVVYVDQENRVIDVVERLQAYGVTEAELDHLQQFLRCYSFPSIPPLNTPRGGQHLLAIAVRDEAALVIIDTTMRMVDGKENDSDPFNQLYMHSFVPLKARGVAVLRLDHEGKDAGRGQRGSSGKEGAEDNVWHLSGGPVSFRLDRDKDRVRHGPDAFELRRRSEPLRHEWTTAGLSADRPLSAAAGQLCGQLEALNVPLDAGRDRIRKILLANDIHASNEQVSDAIKHRKHLSRTGPGQPDSRPDASAVPTRSVGQRTGQSRTGGPGHDTDLGYLARRDPEAPDPSPPCDHTECWEALVARCLRAAG